MAKSRDGDGLDEPRFNSEDVACAVQGRVRWSWKKSLWSSGMWAGAVTGICFFASIGAVLLFFMTTAGVLCFGHSLGMHRRLIHNSFECPLALEYLLVYLGVLVGLGGPMSMIYTHDIRDWAQRKS